MAGNDLRSMTESVRTILTVSWDEIGLRGVQNVRDLWVRKDLGEFTRAARARFDQGRRPGRQAPSRPLAHAARKVLCDTRSKIFC